MLGIQSFSGSRELNITVNGRLKFLKFQSPVPANREYLSRFLGIWAS